MILTGVFVLGLTAAPPSDNCLAALDAALEFVANESGLGGEVDLPVGADAVLTQIRAAHDASSLEDLQEASLGYDSAAAQFVRAKSKECPRKLREQFLEKTDDLMYELELDTVRKVLAGMFDAARNGQRPSVAERLGELPMFLGTAWEQEISESLTLVSSLHEHAGLAHAEKVRTRIVEIARERECIRGEVNPGVERGEYQLPCPTGVQGQKSYPEELEVLATIFEDHLSHAEHMASSAVLVRSFSAAKGGAANRVAWADPRFDELMSLIVALQEDELSEEKLEKTRNRFLSALGDWRNTDVYGEVAKKINSYLNWTQMQQRRRAKLDPDPGRSSPEDMRRRRRLITGWVGGSLFVIGSISGLAVVKGLQTNGWHDADGRDQQLVLSQWGPTATGASIATLGIGAVMLIATTANDCARKHVICGRKEESTPMETTRAFALPGTVIVRF